MKVSISSRYDVQNSLSTSFMATSSILMYTLPALANPKGICMYWNMPNGLINAAKFNSYCMICSAGIQR